MAFWIIIGIIVIIALALIMIYNRLVALRQDCRQGWADIDAQLRQRHDLIPNLVNIVKGYATHEKETLDAVITARNSAQAASSPTQTAAAEGMLAGALKNLFALAENYPDLKANTNFLSLQGELADVEDKLAASRRAYNAVTADYNGAIESFPAVLVAGSFGFRERNFWELGEAERTLESKAPDVQF